MPSLFSPASDAISVTLSYTSVTLKLLLPMASRVLKISFSLCVVLHDFNNNEYSDILLLLVLLFPSFTSSTRKNSVAI